MKIDRVRWAAYRIPFRVAYTTSQGNSTHQEGLLVEVSTDDGRVGFGEAAPRPESAIAASKLAGLFESKAPTLIGQEVVDLASYVPAPEQPDEAAAAVDCAIDTAICDLLAQSRGLNLARLLTLDATDTVEVNALISKQDIIEASQAAEAARKAGFRTFKLKVGMEESSFDEVARIAAVRKAIGPRHQLRLDPNGAWDIATAIETLGAVVPLNIEYVEQPVPPGSLDSLRYVQSHAFMPIAADEDLTDFESALQIVETQAAKVLILKPQRVGGLRACREIMALAYDAGLKCVVTTSIETGIGTAACLHLSASLPVDSPACGLATATLLASDLTTAPIAVKQGSMQVPQTAGIGVSLDAEALARYADGWHEVS